MRIIEFQNKGLEISWTLLLICFSSNVLLKNSEYETKFISEAEIIDYAKNLLTETDDPRVVSLAILSESEYSEILLLLQQLSDEENCNYSFEFKKFRAMYIAKHLPEIFEPFIQGILKISEIWARFDFPSDSPNIWYKFDEYTRSNFENLIHIHDEWLHVEFKELASY